MVTIGELSRLLAEGTTELDVAEALATDPALSSKFELNSGYLTERFPGPSPDILEYEEQNRSSARRNLVYANRFAPLLRASGFLAVAVSGSTSYGSASLSRDLDLFCVAPSGKMWVSLTTSLLMARMFSVLHREAPPICLSCVLDEDFARTLFESNADPLLARDALQAQVIQGQEFYDSLLSQAHWIKMYYPIAYQRKNANGDKVRSRGASLPTRILDRFLLFTVGRYIRLKSSALNRKLDVAGRKRDLFKLLSGQSHLIYESRRYGSLREEYRRSISPSTGGRT